jgi:hypothetical protein
MGRVEDLENWGYAEDQQGTCIFARGRARDQGMWDGLGIIGGLIPSPEDGIMHVLFPPRCPGGVLRGHVTKSQIFSCISTPYVHFYDDVHLIIGTL